MKKIAGVLMCLLIAACDVRSEKPLLPEISTATTVIPDTLARVKTCSVSPADKQGATPYCRSHALTREDGKLIGALVHRNDDGSERPDNELFVVALHPLPGHAGAYVVQFTYYTAGRPTVAQYGLLKADADKYRMYNFIIKTINKEYLASIVARGGVTLQGEGRDMLGTWVPYSSRDLTLQNKEALYAFMGDMAQLSTKDLASIAEVADFTEQTIKYR